MKPINDFHEDTQSLFLMVEEDRVDPIGVLPMRHGYADTDDEIDVMISVWRVSFVDLLRMLFTRRLYLVVMGRKWPPLFVETDRAYTGIDEYDRALAET